MRDRNGHFSEPPGSRLHLLARIGVPVGLVILLVPVAVSAYRIFRADRLVRFDETLEAYTRAVESDPYDAELRWKRGRLRHYSVRDTSIPGALTDYEQALTLNPRLGQAWLDLAECRERLGDLQRAEEALERGVAVRPFSPVTLWQAGNFHLRRGNLPKMYRAFRRAVEYDPSKAAIAMEIAWKIEPDRRNILDSLIPETTPLTLQYLEFLVARGELDLADAAWARHLRDPVPYGFEYRAGAAFRFVDALLDRRQVEDALRVWSQGLVKSGHPRDPRADAALDLPATVPSANLVWNGSFETESLGGGFDWRYSSGPVIRYETDLKSPVAGLKSMRVNFGGSNLVLADLTQVVPLLHPGHYELEYFLRAEELTTDQRPYLVVRGYPEPNGIFVRGEMFPPSTPWKKNLLSFIVSGAPTAARIHLQRDRSSKFDNELRGTLWLDGVTLRRTSAGEPAPVRPE